MNMMQTEIKGNNPIETIERHGERSDKYTHFSSKHLITYLESKGLELKGTSYGKVRKASKDGFQKHIMLFSNDDMELVDGNHLQLLVTNSHDGTSSVVLNLGVFRTVCANGLVVGDSYLEHRVRHTNKNIYRIIFEKAKELINKMPSVKEQIVAMQRTTPSIEQMVALRELFIKERLKGKNLVEFDTRELSRPLRAADYGRDLYTIFNKYQEKIIKGGIKFAHKTKDELGNDVVKQNTTRKVKSIDRQKELNKFMWSEATKLAA